MPMTRMTMIAAVGLAAAVAGDGSVGAAASGAAGAEISISYPAALGAGPLDGRIILLLSRDLTREPRTHVEPDEPLASPYIFGLNVEGLAPAHAVVLDDHAFGWPAAHLSSLPPGDYFVQAVLNRYETFHLGDGRVLKLPPDQGEGQQWAQKPGNLYSIPVRVHVDSKHPLTTPLILDQQIAPLAPKSDSEYVRHIRIKSELLSKFWGRE